jgi:aspartate racemase
MTKKKLVGVIGGMGPEATVDFFHKLIKSTPAVKDQDHLRVIIDNNTNIPDRTQAILGKGPSPVEEIRKSAKLLDNAGAEIIVMSCNTAHYYYDEIVNDVNAEFLHTMKVVAKHIISMYPAVKRVGLLATTGTIETKLYHNAFKEVGLKIIVPDDFTQLEVMEAVYAPWGIKAGKYSDANTVLKRSAQKLISDGAELLVMGCTEIPLALAKKDVQVNLLDSTEVLANEVVARAFK